MKIKLTHRERIENCLAGSRLDRIPIAFWRHFPVDDQDPYRLAAAVSQFQDVYQFDIIKVTSASSYCLRDWGVSDEWRGNWEGTRVYTNKIIENPEDWLKLPLLQPSQGILGDQLTCLNILTKKYGHDTLILPTIFSPLAQAKHLVGGQELLVHLRHFPDALHKGLQIITDTTVAYIEAACRVDISGIFYAIQHANYQLLSKEEYYSFGAYYDLQILEAANKLWLNLCHIHGENIMFDMISTYPVQVFNWHDRQTPPSLDQAQSIVAGVVCGGLQQWKTMAIGTPVDVANEATQAIQSTNGKRFILGTGCVLPIITPHGNIQAALETVDQITGGTN